MTLTTALRAALATPSDLEPLRMMSARDVPHHAWVHLLRVITTPQTPPRRSDIQARMDALAADIAKESA